MTARDDQSGFRGESLAWEFLRVYKLPLSCLIAQPMNIDAAVVSFVTASTNGAQSVWTWSQNSVLHAPPLKSPVVTSAISRGAMVKLQNYLPVVRISADRDARIELKHE